MHHHIIELERTGSTNLFAEQLLASQEVDDGTVILALEQTAGKGQGENTWESEPGKNLTFSLVLLPEFLLPELQFLLNKAITLGILDYLQSLTLSQTISIKWPNDIYAGNRKIGGLLINNTIRGNLFASSVAGIGININQDAFNPGIPNPVSLKQLTGIDHPLRGTLESLLSCIDHRYMQLKSGKSGPLDTDYRRNLLGYCTWQNYFVNNMVKKGRILDVDENGKLIIETGEGSVLSLNHGEIGFILT
ncbi:MAG: biotin--[acetyl-CoA-carboxylase] ligase [Bacteroidetes bacterium]|nr:biotin--[acetyl-CoA-carboxylase] ligase [Bacteroidota bacterium]